MAKFDIFKDEVENEETLQRAKENKDFAKILSDLVSRGQLSNDSMIDSPEAMQSIAASMPAKERTLSTGRLPSLLNGVPGGEPVEQPIEQSMEEPSEDMYMNNAKLGMQMPVGGSEIPAPAAAPDKSLAKASPVPSSVPSPEGDQSLLGSLMASNLSGVEQAQQARRAALRNAEMARLGESIRAGLSSASGIKKFNPNYEDSDRMARLGELNLQEVKERQDLIPIEQMQDPNSLISKEYRKLYKDLVKQDLPEGVSAFQITKALPMIQQLASDKLSREKLAAEAKTKSGKLSPLEELQLDLVKEQKKAELKDENKIKEENRKERSAIRKALPKFDEQIKLINNAISTLKNTKGLSDTGPLDKYVAPYTTEGQNLQLALNSLQLDKMVSMFSGMSKAIDSDAERAFFQASQPDMSKYPSSNLKALQAMLDRTKLLKKKAEQEASLYDRTGKFTVDEIGSNSEESSPSIEVKRKTKDGKIAIFDAQTKEFLRYEE